MEFTVNSLTPDKQQSSCLITGVFEKGKLSASARHIDKASGGGLSAILQRGDLEGKPGQTLLLYNLANIGSDRVLLVGLGEEQEFGDQQYRDAVAKSVSAVNELGCADLCTYLPELAVTARDAEWKVRQVVETTNAVLYRFEQLKSKPPNGRRALQRTVLALPADSDVRTAEQAVIQGEAIGAGITLVKNLGNLPANICTPSYLADQARELQKQYGVKTTVLEQADMESLGMGALLSVARGSQEPPKFITIEYNGGKKGEAPIALVGKGVTFDSGGISIKPAAAMDEMKFDMCGAASVLGTIKAIAEMQLPLNVVGVIPSTENMPSGSATKPGDIVKSLSGQTVEILNTDAEGRLILCDALTYTERFNPAAVIDIATLTGACVIALGNHASGLMSNNDALAAELLEAGKYTGDRAWQLPLWEDYQKQLESNFADMANVGGREAGAITGACFLARYTKKFNWAHFDIAGTAWKSGKEKGATGRPVPLLTQFLINRSRNQR
jgi:leucyl aminopeptidase